MMTWNILWIVSRKLLFYKYKHTPKKHGERLYSVNKLFDLNEEEGIDFIYVTNRVGYDLRFVVNSTKF